MRKKNSDNKLMTLEIDQENLGLLLKYQGEFQTHIGHRISRNQVINMAIKFFVTREHKWPKSKE